MRFSAKLATTLLLASVASVSFAGHAANYKDTYKDAVPCPALPSLMGGFYVGAQAGYDAYRLHSSLTTATSSSSTSGSLTGWVGGLFVGYGQYFSDYYYLGGELLGNYNNNSQTLLSANDSAGNSEFLTGKAKGTWGISLLPGIKMNETTLGYLRLGYDWTNFQLNSSATVAGVGSFSSSKSSTQGGFDFGLGLETLVYQNWSVRTEYNHVWYSSINSSSGSTSGSMSPSDNQFMLGAVYHFA